VRPIGDESSGDLLERDGELAAIDAFARDERAAVLVVEGPAGAGKTRLLSALREAVAQDA
jgi:predicted ATPase